MLRVECFVSIFLKACLLPGVPATSFLAVTVTEELFDMIFQQAKHRVCRFHKGVRLNAIALACGLFGLGLQSVFSAAVVRTQYSPTDDAHVKSGFSSKKNFGSEPALELQNNRGTVSEGFLKFNLTGVDRNLKEARLRVHLTPEKADSTTVLVRSTLSGNWTESTLTWKDKPEHFNSIASIQLATLVAGWYEIDITTFLKTELASGN
jgi:hypothetical protein